jgi:hypothetical protein
MFVCPYVRAKEIVFYSRGYEAVVAFVRTVQGSQVQILSSCFGLLSVLLGIFLNLLKFVLNFEKSFC